MGPVQEYVSPMPNTFEFPINSIVVDVHGEPPVAGWAIGNSLIVTVVASIFDTHPSTVTTRLYAPPSIASVGF